MSLSAHVVLLSVPVALAHGAGVAVAEGNGLPLNGTRRGKLTNVSGQCQRSVQIVTASSSR
jgi:hypothetical protein